MRLFLFLCCLLPVCLQAQSPCASFDDCYSRATGPDVPVLERRQYVSRALDMLPKGTLSAEQSERACTLLGMRAATYLELNENDRARTDLERINQLQPRHPRYLMGMATFAVMRAKPDEAVRLLNEAIDTDPNLVEAYEQLVALHTKRQEYRPAADLMTRLTRRFAGNWYESLAADATLHSGITRLGTQRMAELYYQQALLAMYASRSDTALLAFRNALLLKPNWPDALYERARLHRALGKRDLALTDLTELKKLQPRDCLALSLRGKVLAELGNATEGLQECLAASRLPDCPTGYAWAAELMADARNWQGAKEAATQALEDPTLLAPDEEAAAQYALGAALLASNDKAKARTALRRAADLGHPNAARLLASL